jgi:hypothetical protein
MMMMPTKNDGKLVTVLNIHVGLSGVFLHIGTLFGLSDVQDTPGIGSLWLFCILMMYVCYKQGSKL